ncbi:MAG: amino acid adenylation domain-containing protein, partial [Acidobacteria bacterium]|nr:amino acid adenylation domain-containing protein [Acidobacteriota bacterium]
LTGGRVVLLPPGRSTPEAIAQTVAEHGVTTAFITAGLFHLVVDELPEALRPLRHVLSGGEVLSPARVRRVLELRDGPVMSNVYGPTENTTFSTHHPMVAASQAVDPVPIGRTITNSSLWVVDGRFRPVPVGVVGELVLGGDGLARGYLGRPALTAERFVPSPWAETGGERLYRTGDQVRWRTDGALDFVGRGDFQVKVRGFRIELGEVETALTALPEVQRAVVVAATDAAVSSKRLVAYVVPAADPAGVRLQPEPALLRQALLEALPDYMVPAAFVVLEELPLNANGKVDRGALPDPDWAGAAVSAPYRPPTTLTETLIAEIWGDVLTVSRVGLDDDFFALGGHSLLATQVIARLRDAFQVELPLRALFEGPSVAELARAVMGAKASGTALQAPPLVTAPRAELRSETPLSLRGGAMPASTYLPLSFAQQRLWFIEQMQPENPVYNMPMPVRVEGPLSPALLRRSIAGVIERHEALRTTFSTVDEQPVQVIHPPTRWALPLVDLSGLGAVAAKHEAGRLVGEDAVRPFDLNRGPVMRVSLVRLAPELHVVIANMHHIVSDGWSLTVLMGEIGELYEAASAGRDAELEPLPIQYGDYAVWQRNWLAGEVLESELAFWRRQLAGAPPVLELPTDRPRPPVRGIAGGTLDIAFDAELVARLRARSRESGVTVFMTMLALFQALLARYSGQEDILVGSPVAGRTHTETESLIGFFVNSLVLRTDLADGPSLEQLLHRVRDVSLEAYAHQGVPFEKLVEELRPERSMAFTPLFQVMFVYQNTPQEPVELTELRLDAFTAEEADRGAVGETMAKFDLTLGLQEVGDDLSGDLEFSRDLFDASTIARMARHLELLARRWLDRPELSYRDVELLSTSERRQLAEWNETGSARPAARSLHEAFAAQVRATPEAPALVAGGVRWSYRELADRSRSLAERLRRLGVGREVPVVVCLERSAELPMALLAVLEAGGAYVPVDPGYPAERRRFMLEDSAAPVAITRGDLLDDLLEDLPDGPEEGASASAARRILRLDGEEPEVEVAAASVPSGSGPDAGDLAYVIYTSGSTGRPKGVAIEHRSALALLEWADEHYGSEDLAGVLAATSVCFDLSVFEIFLPLTRGGTVVLEANALALADPDRQEAEVRLINTVPSAMAELVHGGAVPASVRTVNLAGEALSRELVEQIYRTTAVERVFNLYGPSEDTTYSTWARIERGGTDAPAIGRPIVGTTAYVVDRRHRPVPIGVAGELLLGGEGLARGYLGRARLTAEKWLPDPEGAPGARRYRTGDLVRRRNDGELDFLGRIDHQVKVRGFRIELGEVESAIGASAGVREVVVTTWAPSTGDLRLVAYVVLDPGAVDASLGETAEDGRETDRVAAIRQHLETALPAYMVPSHILVLPEMPRT